ncbi:MAG: hypothetical protein OXC06_07870 [Acidimicrobiaceae bacterium]|nr:hypothetical protein [Acidimicrobiaceae bacterium]
MARSRASRESSSPARAGFSMRVWIWSSLSTRGSRDPPRGAPSPSVGSASVRPVRRAQSK